MIKMKVAGDTYVLLIVLTESDKNVEDIKTALGSKGLGATDSGRG